MVCSCRPAYQAQVWSPRDRKTIRKTFPTLPEARAWRQETHVALRTGTFGTPSAISVGEAAAEWLERADAGLIRTRSGDPYKPAALRAYRHALDCRILPRFGDKRLNAISPNMLTLSRRDCLSPSLTSRIGRCRAVRQGRPSSAVRSAVWGAEFAADSDQ